MVMGSLAPDMDWVDRANGFWTVLLLSTLALASHVVRVNFELPACWLPVHFPSGHSLYVYKKAGLETSYYMNNLLEELPLHREHLKAPSYHLYVPRILFMQAVGFFVPFVIWRVLRKRMALDLTGTSASLTTALATGTSGSNAMVRQTASLLLESLSGSKFLLTAGYFVVKALSLVNVVAQLIALTVVFHKRLGFATGNAPELPYFPVEVVYDFSIRQLQVVQNFTVQCSLLVNDTYIRMFVFIWYWVAFLALITFVDTALSAVSLLIPALRDGSLVTYVRAGDYPGPLLPGHEGQQGPQGPAGAAGRPSPAQVKQWVSSALGSDGVLILSHVSSRDGAHLAARLAQEMWFLTHPGPEGHEALSQALPHRGLYPSTQGPQPVGQLYPTAPLGHFLPPQGMAAPPDPHGYPSFQPPQEEGKGSKDKGEEGNDLEMKPLI